MIFQRRKQRRHDTAAAERIADEHLEQANRFAEQAEELGADFKRIRLRNGLGEAIASSFELKRGWPWTR